MMIKKILFLLTLLFVFVFPLFAIVVVPNNHAASFYARERQKRERIEHIEKYHQGEMSFDSRIYDKIEKENDSYFVVRYEEKVYFYENDPEKCTIKTVIQKVAYRNATDIEIENCVRNEYRRIIIVILSISVGIIAILVACSFLLRGV